METAVIETPIGCLLADFGADALWRLAFADSAPNPKSAPTAQPIVTNDAPRWLTWPLARYFAGQVNALEAIPLNPRGTEFQHRVWDAVRAIPVGQVARYGDIAAAIGQARASQAVGAANRHNPILLAIPCHRVIASDGDLRGYVAGIPRKRWLLEHESAALPQMRFAWGSRGPTTQTVSIS